jgi:hypothetical protein
MGCPGSAAESEFQTRRRIHASGLVLLFSLALLPRITGLVAFTPWDETWGPSVRVLTGDLSAGTSQTLPLINYLNAVSFVPLYAIGRLIGVWHGTEDFRNQYFADRTPFVFAGRLVSACLGALTAVLAALIASRLGLTRRSSLLVGGTVALFPTDVWLSHIAKTDSGVAFGVLLLTWSILRKLDNPEQKKADVLVGVALALTLSFKQTALLVVAPALVGMAALLRWDCRLPWSRVARGLLVSLIAYILVWIPLNIGVLLNINRFLEWQRFLLIAVEAGQPATVYHIAELAVRSRFQSMEGLTAAGFLVWLIAPFVRHDRKFLMLWFSSAFAYVAINVASGPVVYFRYYFPYDELAFTLACVAALSMLEREGLWRPLGLFSLVAILACAVDGSLEIVKEAMATPMGVRCSKVIKAIADPGRDKILTADVYSLGVPVDASSGNEERERNERLAKKYGMTMPKKPAEMITRKDDFTRGYHVRSIPYSLGGDTAQKASLSSRMGRIMLYWWPIQYEEWDLDYWTTRGFKIFVLIEGAGFSGSGNPLYDAPLYQSFHEQIKERCELVATIPTTRHWFYERKLWIYRLRDLSPANVRPQTLPSLPYSDQSPGAKP